MLGRARQELTGQYIKRWAEAEGPWGQRSELWSTVRAVTLHLGVSISALLALLCGHTVCVPLITDMGEGSLSTPSPFKAVGGGQHTAYSTQPGPSVQHTGPEGTSPLPRVSAVSRPAHSRCLIKYVLQLLG